MLNIIILDNEPFSAIRKRNFFVDEFMSKGYKVYHYNLSNYLAYPNTTQYLNVENSTISHSLYNKQEIKSFLKKVNPENTFIFIELPFNSKTVFIYNLLDTKKLIWGRISYYTNPAVNLYKTKPIAVKQKLNRYKNFNYLRFALFVKLYSKKIKRITTSYFTFKTGNSDYNFPPSRKLISINYFDLEEFRKRKAEKPLVNGDYIVFNDIFLPYHPDLQRIHRGKQYISPQNYFDELNDFFDKVEREYGMEVIIAAHPKANYTKEFGSRKVIYNETSNLIINCKLLITHLSISIDYALFAYKPVLFFYTPSMDNNQALTYMISYMKIYAERIHSLVIDSSMRALPKIKDLKIDALAYHEIILKFFGDPDSKFNNFEKVEKEIQTIFQTTQK